MSSPDITKKLEVSGQVDLLEELLQKNEDHGYVVEQIKLNIPGFLNEYIDHNDLLESHLTVMEIMGDVNRDVTIWSKTGSVPRRARMSDFAPDPNMPTSAPSGSITLSGVIARQLQHNEKCVSIFQALSGVAEGWTVGELQKALVYINQQLGTCEKSEKLGKYSVVSDEDVLVWKGRSDMGSVQYGPYCMMKYLVQANVEFHIYDDKLLGRVIEWSRNDQTVVSYNRRCVQMKKADGNWEVFLSGLMVKSKPVKFVDIGINAYRCVDLLSSLYKIKRESTGKLSFVASGVNIPMPKDIATIIASYKATLEAGAPPSGDVDEMIDWMAMQLNPDEKMVSFMSSMSKVITSAMDGMREALLTVERAPPGEREGAFKKQGATTDPTLAIKQLQADRQVRNCTQVTQYVNKNSGSAHACNLPQFADTLLKGRAMVDAARMLGMPVDDDGAVIHMYGIMYGHMQKYTSTLPAKFQYYDIKKAKLSHANMVFGDYWDATGEYIIDDTYIPNGNEIPKEFKDNLSEVHTVDHAKVLKMIQLKPKVAIIKLSMNNFNTPGRISSVADMVYRSTFKYAQFVKFGKLHNPEVFLMLATGLTRPQTLSKDLMQVTMCISLSNMVIMMGQRKGVRVEHRALMVQVTRSLPVRWPWYGALLKEGVVKGGQYSLRMEVKDEVEGYGTSAFDTDYPDFTV